MTTIEKTAPIADASNLEQIDLAALDAVTGGCGACGQACAAGPAPAAGGAAAQIPGIFPTGGTFGPR